MGRTSGATCCERIEVNEQHRICCGGPEWAALVRDSVVPWVTRGVGLGGHLLEVGPGYGATTDVLRTMVARLTAVELDPDLAAALSERFAGSNVTILNADATEMPFEAGTFNAGICMTMLHHVPTPALQDEILAAMARAVAPGGMVMGSDNLDSPQFRDGHVGDTCVPVDPAGLQQRLERIGLQDVEVETNPFAFRFRGRVA